MKQSNNQAKRNYKDKLTDMDNPACPKPSVIPMGTNIGQDVLGPFLIVCPISPFLGPRQVPTRNQNKDINLLLVGVWFPASASNVRVQKSKTQAGARVHTKPYPYLN